MVLCLGEPLGGFWVVGCFCCYFFSLEGFTFPGYFSMLAALHPRFSGPWRPPPWLLSIALFFAGFSVTVLQRALRFWVDIFYPQTFFTLREHFVTQMGAGTPNPRLSSVPALTELSLLAGAWTWTTHIVVARPLTYQLRQWAMKYRVKVELLNTFCLFKVVYKDYQNTLWARLRHVLLKTALMNIKVILESHPEGSQASYKMINI